jgi:hypothetical protein
MTNRFLMSVAAAALIAGTGFANAQGMGRDTPSAGSATQQGAPSSDRAAPSAATPMNRNDATDSKGSASGMKSTQSDEKMQPKGKSAADSKSSTTTGQAGAGAKLSDEQRSKIGTVIKQQNVAPATNVNFSVSVGTRVPRTVGFHPLPTEVVTVYPEWRGYEFFRVNDQIIVVNPRTLEIVAVLDV